MIRKTFLFFIALLTVFCVQAADKLLVVEMAGGERTYFALSDSPELTFNGHTMLIVTATQSHDFEISNVAQYYFTNKETDIKDVKANDLRIIQSGNGQVIVEGLQPSSVIRIFSLDGKESPAYVTHFGSSKATINLSSLPKGTYIISANKQQHIKINKR